MYGLAHADLLPGRNQEVKFARAAARSAALRKRGTAIRRAAHRGYDDEVITPRVRIAPRADSAPDALGAPPQKQLRITELSVPSSYPKPQMDKAQDAVQRRDVLLA